MKKEVKHLYNKAVDSLVLSIELFNRPNDTARVHGVLIMMDHSFEMLLKASILHKGGKIKDRRATQTIGFESCVRKAFSDGEIKFLTEDEVLTLQSLNGLRDAAQHYTLEISEQHLYFQAQSGLTLFRDIVKRVFDIDLKEGLPVRVLPLSTTPPTDIQAFFSNEIVEIKKLLGPNKRKNIEAIEKLRALAIMENAVQGNDTQPSDGELKKILKTLEKGGNFGQLFPGVSTLNFTASGYGPSLDLRISRKEGVPVQIVPEGTPGAHVVALKRVNELDYYNLGRDQLAKKVGLTGPKTSAVIHHLN
ncbi:DUF3644 domain-containing protein [Croceimicrobium hydrocarbonivorans]|uniref:DUF3644 domain-containing protein n=1 Tax=Croceimicrobium hydrocarbonivorans TaxID=2761580 RepID=A0A7H0VIG9_9FLAO|nr:DUF3644 domain-containing protein [Croceimicrobium hydrocarbonivorans]QNR25517.1 hypothetical protein H4K34_06660 [Croceimicrobium hydrocarbonivorans]